MFTLNVREDGDVNCAGTVQRVSATDPNDVMDLCAAEQADYTWQTGTCTVRNHISPLFEN